MVNGMRMILCNRCFIIRLTIRFNMVIVCKVAHSRSNWDLNIVCFIPNVYKRSDYVYESNREFYLNLFCAVEYSLQIHEGNSF